MAYESTQKSRPSRAFEELINSGKAYEFWTVFAWNDIKARYRRSRVGQFWITFSIAFFIFGIGLFYSEILKVPVSEYLPHLALGFIIWHLISNIVTEGGNSFIEATPIIQQQELPLIAFPMRIVMRNLIIFLHNSVLILFIWILFGIDNALYLPLFIFGLGIIIVSGVCIALIMGMISARYRDVPQITQSLIQIVFFMSPIMWQPHQVGEKGILVAFYNPITHYLEILRAPLLGKLPEPENWIITISITLFLTTVAFLFFARYRSRITYWL